MTDIFVMIQCTALNAKNFIKIVLNAISKENVFHVNRIIMQQNKKIMIALKIAKIINQVIT